MGNCFLHPCDQEFKMYESSGIDPLQYHPNQTYKFLMDVPLVSHALSFQLRNFLYTILRLHEPVNIQGIQWTYSIVD